MLIHIKLRKQLYLILVALIVIVFTGGVAILEYSSQIEEIMLDIVDKDLVKYQITEEMEAALINQKGFVTYFYMDRDPGWLEKLGAYRQVFKERFERIEQLDQSESQAETIKKVKANYEQYIGNINRVINHYKREEIKQGYELHLQVRKNFFEILEAFESYKLHQVGQIQAAWEASRQKGRSLMTSVVATCIMVLIVVLLMMGLLVTRILDPLQLLARKTRRETGGADEQDIIQQLSEDVNDLIEDADHAHEELEQSREILMQSEKLALVGKLAAGMAHSIRNPLTSVKMRLFSLGRTLGMTESQQEDFDVISEEIRHLDIIVQNFLEFSRPPRLTMQQGSLSTVVDQSLQLLEHRLKSYNVTVDLDRKAFLPDIQCDPEQLKEVFVNLIVNACEAMQAGGEIVIEERVKPNEKGQRAVIRIIDNGPGIPESVLDHVFQPFFTTKEEGTGLGLSIAARIVTDHGGTIKATSQPHKGTVFTLSLPIQGD